MQPIQSVLETIIYSSDLPAVHAFYRDVLGLSPLGDPSQLAAGFRVSDTHVLLVFNPEVSRQPGRDVPSHGPTGAGHIAFRIQPDDFDAWQSRLTEHGVEIEQVHSWEQGGRSIYCRDPAGNSVELIDTDIWPDNRANRPS
ncbi:MAG: VOC family protein [Phycisphaerales bacterium]|nr:VOC family protein [Phycisphaerales bacterium]